ncbi:hypothetical protein C8J56DRAFT_890035 [Mycena floridula]|nr:hypothetical protein C8J56DRAFT_890035 [Mycena floridula]
MSKSKTKNQRKTWSMTRANNSSSQMSNQQDNPNAGSSQNSLAQSTPTPSGGNLLNAPGAHKPARYQFTPRIGANLRNMAPLLTLSSLDMLTLSPGNSTQASAHQNGNPFIRTGNVVAGTGIPTEPVMLTDWRIRKEATATMNRPNSAPVGATSNPIVVETFFENNQNFAPTNVNPRPNTTITDNVELMNETQHA